jgi:creatinine amidohydrolase
MRIADMNWMQVEDYLKHDDRCVLPVGSTEQHAYLSLCVDNILAEKVALETAEPLNIPVFPVLNYGITPYFQAYPGSVSLRVTTYLAIFKDILDGIAQQGFRRILVVNGHGGNTPAQTFIIEWMAEHPGCMVKWHNWWSAPRTMAQVNAIDDQASHASWMENFAWTRLPGVPMPDVRKPMPDFDKLRLLSPQALRNYLGDGNYGGYYQRPDDEMQAIWDVAIAETRELLTENWE